MFTLLECYYNNLKFKFNNLPKEEIISLFSKSFLLNIILILMLMC